MILTARQALEICIELWTWLRDNPDKEKYEWPSWEKYGAMVSECPLCEYIGIRECSKCCPIYWRRKPNLSNHCTRYDSPYDKWCATESLRSKRFYAGKIVKLAEEALERMGE